MAGPNDFYMTHENGVGTIHNGSLDEPKGVPSIHELAQRGDAITAERAILVQKAALIAKAEAEMEAKAAALAAREAALEAQMARAKK